MSMSRNTCSRNEYMQIEVRVQVGVAGDSSFVIDSRKLMILQLSQGLFVLSYI